MTDFPDPVDQKFEIALQRHHVAKIEIYKKIIFLWCQIDMPDGLDY